MGVSNDTHVVLYDNNEKLGMYSVGRAWWMFKVSSLLHCMHIHSMWKKSLQKIEVLSLSFYFFLFFQNQNTSC